MVCRNELRNDEIVNILDREHIVGSNVRYTLSPDLNVIGDLNSLLKFLHAGDIKVTLQLMISD